MKKILCMALCLILAAAMLVGCNEPKEEPHKHTYASEWSTSATEHWHASTCDHNVTADKAAHDDTIVDGVCDVCQYVLYYTVTVAAPAEVTVEGTLTAAPGADVTFTATVDADYRLVVNGAEVVSTTEQNGNKVYTCKVSAIAANTNVSIIAEKVVFGGVVAEDETAFTQTTMNTKAPITVNVPAAGTYLIYELANEETGATLGFTFADTVDAEEWSTYYVFTAEEAGDVAIAAKRFSFSYANEGEMVLAYRLVAIEDVILPSLTGNGYILPTNAFINVTITLPAAGLYQITAGENVAINDNIGAVLFSVGADDLTYTFTVKLNDETEATFEFDWVITALPAPVELTDSVEITVPASGYVGLTYTAAVDGTYCISTPAEGIYVYLWNGEYNTMTCWWEPSYEINLTAGESVTVYYGLNPYAEEPADVAATISAIQLGNIIDGWGGALADADGLLNSYKAGYAGYYNFTPGENVSYSFDGETWYTEAQEIYMEAGYCNVYLKLADATEETEVYFEIIKSNYELYPTVGDNTVYMTPDRTYDLYVGNFYTDSEGMASVTFTWTDANLTVYVNGVAVTSGEAVSIDVYSNYTITALYNGEPDTEIELSIVDNNAPVIPDALEGEKYMVYFYGMDLYSVIFNAELGKVRIENLQNGANNGIYNYTVVDGVYTITNDAGEDAGFIISYNMVGGLTFQAPGMMQSQDLVPATGGDSGDGGDDDEPVEVGLNTDIAVNFESLYAGNCLISFTAPVEGTYTLAALAGENDAWVDLWINGDRANGMMSGDPFSSYSFDLDAGETIVFWVASWSEDPATIDLIITGETGGTPDPDVTISGDKYEVYFSGSALMFNITIDVDNGKMTIEDLNSGALTGTYNFAMVDGAPVVTKEDGSAADFMMGVALNGNLTIQPANFPMAMELTPVVEGGEDGGETDGGLVLGENTIAVSAADAYYGVSCTFTAPVAGTYTLTSVSANAFIMFPGRYDIEAVIGASSVTFEMAAGETIEIAVGTQSGADTIIFVIAQA